MELERLVAALVRRWWIVAAVGLLGALIGQIAEFSRSDLYTATATVETAPDRNVYGSETVLNRLVINEIATIGNAQLRQSVVEDLGAAGADIDPFLDLAVQQVPDTELVNLSVSASNEETAITAANSWALEYVTIVRERERDDRVDHLNEVSTQLSNAREERLRLDAALRDTVVVRRNGTVSTYTETVLREPELWDGIVKVDQEIQLLLQERTDAEVAVANVLDSSVTATAVGPIDPVRTGNGLGAFEGLLIGLSLAGAGVAVLSLGSMSHRAADQITNSVWPTSLRLSRSRFTLPRKKRRIEANISAVGTQILTRLPDTRLQVVSFASLGGSNTQKLKTELASNLRSRGYSVSLMGDDHAAAQSRSVEGMLDLLHATDSVLFADHDELQSKRFTGRIVTVVAIDEHRDSEHRTARQIAESLEVSDSVLTVVAR